MNDLQKADAPDDGVISKNSLGDKILVSAKGFFIKEGGWVSLVLSLISLLIYSYAPALSSFLAGVATSYLASIIIAERYKKIVGDWESDVISEQTVKKLEYKFEEVKSDFRENKEQISSVVTSAIRAEMKTIHSKFVPIDVFPAANVTNNKVKEAIIQGLKATRTYKFKGGTGIYISRWIEEVPDKHLNLEVLLFDPRKVERVLPYFEPNSNLEDVKKDIYGTIVKLFELRDKATIRIRIYEDSVFYRVEMFDNYALVSFYETSVPHTKFPAAYLYGKDSIHYQAFYADFSQTWELNAKDGEEFSTTTREDTLKDFLRKLEYPNADNWSELTNPSTREQRITEQASN